MGRPKGSKNSRKRNSARSAYQTYSDWYDKYTKGYKNKFFSPKYHEKEQYTGDQESFEYWYKRAKAKGYSNPARHVAMSQEYVERSFEKAFVKKYGKDPSTYPLDLSNKKERIKFAEDFVNDLMQNGGLTESDAWEEFREYFY